MQQTAFMGLIRIDFPGHELLLSDGGFMVWGADTFRSSDSVYGVIGGAEAITEGLGDEVPVFELTLLPPEDTAASVLATPGSQAAQAQFWLAEYDYETGALIGTPDEQFDGQVDQINLAFGQGTRTMGISIVSNTARLLERNIGNSLNSAFHKAIWSGETGHDNGDGLGRQVAWGVESAPGAKTGVSGAFAGWLAQQ